MAAKSNKKKSTKQTKKTQKKTVNQGNFILGEIAVWISLALSVLILLSLFGIGGSIGACVSGFLKDWMGYGAYLFPFFLMGIVGTFAANQHNKSVWGKNLSLAVLLLLICALLQLVCGEGGDLGGIIVDLLVPRIGFVGSFVILLILTIICMVIITEKSALKGVKKGSDKVYGKAKENAKRVKANNAQRRERMRKEREAEEQEALGRSSRIQRKEGRQRRRSDQHIEGVTYNTTLKPAMEAVKSPEMEELLYRAEQDPFSEAFSKEIPEQEEGCEIAEYEEFLDEDLGLEVATEDFPYEQDFTPEDSLPSEEDLLTEENLPLAEDFTPADPQLEELQAAKAEPEPEPAIKETSQIEKEMQKQSSEEKVSYQFPPVRLLHKGSGGLGDSQEHLRRTAKKLEETLKNFGVKASITEVSCGPSVTRYELQPELGVKVSKIVGLADDIKLNLAATDIRIEAPIPGKAAVGIEVPNKENSAVAFRDLIESKEFQNSKSKISFAVGKDIAGKVVVSDIAKMPHVLIAGATGSGKSVCINTLIMSILYKARPDEVKLIMIDPKVVELSVYNGIPHLLIPVVTDPKKASGALNWAVQEMTKRYQLFAQFAVRDMKSFNEKVRSMPADSAVHMAPMYQLIVIVDELADLMMVASKEVEEAICRLAQLARAAGIHLVVATQRPSVNVITGLIKANMPSRIAFSVTSGVDSRTIIDMNGAEKLLGKGDMLFYPAGYPKPVRVQGSFVSDEEVSAVVDFLKGQSGANSYNEEIAQQINNVASQDLTKTQAQESSAESAYDSYFADAGRLIVEKEKASIGILQRAFKIGFNRAARIMDQLCEAGVVGGEEGTKPRKVLMTLDEFNEFISKM